ncbi:MAG: helix-turn-helix domain-containing protein [Clostridium perfringens]|nr:helix-turn-helix domain-containing protein [Clostridium perfringens]
MKKDLSSETKCGLLELQRIISGKWKIYILWSLYLNTMRFGELNRLIPNITQSMLTKQLRELEQDGFVKRYVYREVPPRVEYSLTELGLKFIPLVKEMRRWSEENLV